MKKTQKFVFMVGFALTLLCTAAFAQQKGTFTDPRDKKVYKWVKIGEQTWMAQNLDYEADGSKCYDNEPSNCNIYGRLYNWETALKVCPAGWHLPTNAEWDKLYRYVHGNSGTESPYKSEVAGKYLKAKSGWAGNGNGTDSYGFAALPGGYGISDGDFDLVGTDGNWWSATESSANYAYGRFMGYDREYAGWYDYGKTRLRSVRCVQN